MQITTDRENRLVGFDRKIRLSWLDATADWAAQGLAAPVVRTRLDRLLDGELAGKGSHGARGKTITVLLHVWLLVPDTMVPLRDDGLGLLRGHAVRNRLPLHWGMCLATYPIFRDVAATTGRLLSLQGHAALSQIVRRITETWGARSTVTRAVQRIVRSFVVWGVLAETDERGVFSPAPRIAVHDAPIAAWLLEAGLVDADVRELPLHSVARAPVFYPFDFRLSARAVNDRSRLEIRHHPFGGPVVACQGAR